MQAVDGRPQYEAYEWEHDDLALEEEMKEAAKQMQTQMQATEEVDTAKAIGAEDDKKEDPDAWVWNKDWQADEKDCWSIRSSWNW